MTTVIIPCAGDNLRWGYDYPKQLAQIDDETIIGRLVRQCHAVGATPLIVTHDKGIIRQLPEDVTILKPARHRWLTETLLHVAPFPDERILILLGDVIFHQRCFDLIWSDDYLTQFYGNVHEIFALACYPKRLEYLLKQCTTYAARHRTDTGAGKLWSVYKAITYVPQDEPVVQMDKYFTHINDRVTTDIDTITEYEAYIRDIVEPGLLDKVEA